MSNRLPGLALLCVAFVSITLPAYAEPPYKVLNHESIRIDSALLGNGRQHLSLSAFGKQFELSLQPNENIGRAVPKGRSDIQPMQGTVDGLAGSWVRVTRTGAGWRGMVFDGHELYAIEPVGDVGDALVQPHPESKTAPIMYRLADALMTVGTGFCATLDADGTPTSEGTTDSSEPGRPTALKVFQAVAADLTSAASTAEYPSKRLMTGIVADAEFAAAFDDPKGAIIARMNVVDGIFTSQVGVKIALAPLTLLNSATEPLTSTAPNELLGQLRQYRNSTSSQMSLGVTHLMTGRNLDGDIVGISYQGAICNGATSAGLSEGWHSTTMSALIAAHELGHNFNAPHDGVSGPCSSTPQTYLMSPTINGSNQFSNCSLQQMQARIQTAQCLTPYAPPDILASLPNNAVGAAVNTPFTVSYTVSALGDDPSNAVLATVALPVNYTVQSATADGAACTQGVGSVSCALGTLAPGESRDIQIQLTATAVGTTSFALGVNSSNDSNTSDNSSTLTVNISETTPAPSPPTQEATGSGGSSSPAASGGGGSLDLVVLAFLALGAYVRTMRRSLASTC
jgi:hypothetical protein